MFGSAVIARPPNRVAEDDNRASRRRAILLRKHATQLRTGSSSIWKKLGETRATGTWIGSPLPVRLRLSLVQTATDSKGAVEIANQLIAQKRAAILLRGVFRDDADQLLGIAIRKRTQQQTRS